jgi:dihydroorotate dehydrogenase
MKNGILKPGPHIVRWNAQRYYSLFGINLDNPLGLAAGFDKNGELADKGRDYGFGFVEVGSVTLRGGDGNPKPRLFRLPNDRLLNRMGLNGEPADVVARRLDQVNELANPFGVNIAKTHDPQIMGDDAIFDICRSYRLLNHLGIYTVINISCPNTREGRTFENPGALRELLEEINTVRTSHSKPLLVKISALWGLPRSEHTAEFYKEREELIQVCEDANVDGYVAVNTLPTHHPKHGKGGLSGPLLFDYCCNAVIFLRERVSKPIIAVGGITNHHRYRTIRTLGANAVQCYTGFVRGENAGVQFAHNILRGHSIAHNVDAEALIESAMTNKRI